MLRSLSGQVGIDEASKRLPIASPETCGAHETLRGRARSRTVVTDAARTATGISGLDGVLHGGLPRGKTALIVGTPGSGKTMLGLQFLVEGILRFDEPGMVVTFEEAPDMLRSVAVGLGLPDDATGKERLHIFDGRPIIDAVAGGAFDIGGLVATSARRCGVWAFSGSRSTVSMRCSR